MSVPLVINGITYNYPEQFDTNWGPTLTAWSTAVSNSLLQKSGGSFPLTSEVDFGNAFGIRAKYLKSEESSIAATGVIRLASQSAGIVFRNTLDNADLVLTTDASNMLTFNGVQLGPLTSLLNGHMYVGDVSNQPADVVMSGDTSITNTGVVTIANSAINNAKVSNSAAIDRSKTASGTAYVILANDSAGVMSENAPLNPDFAIVSDGNGQLYESVTTTLELSYVSGATSNLQAQINTIAAGATIMPGTVLDFAGTVAPSGYLVCDGSSLLRASYPDLFTAIGTTWGSADGTHFNIPALSRRTTVGSGGSGSGTLGNAVGNTGGAETVTLTVAQIPANLTVIDGGHAHVEQYAIGAGATTSIVGTVNLSTAAPNGAGITTAVSTTGISVGGDGTSHNNIQPSAVMLKIIKT